MYNAKDLNVDVTMLKILLLRYISLFWIRNVERRDGGKGMKKNTFLGFFLGIKYIAVLMGFKTTLLAI